MSSTPVRRSLAQAPRPRAWVLALWMLLGVIAPTTPLLAAEPPTAQRALDKAEQLEQRVVENTRTSPAPPALRVTPEGARALDPRGQAPLDDALTCLARSIYWEAKGAGVVEMEAVANVVMNRLGNPAFPPTLCGVVQQGSETGSCQFSWWCDGRPDEAREPLEYAAAREIARRALNGTLKDRTHGAVFFHQRSITPSWASHMVKTAQTREFDFYRLPG